LYLLSEPIHNAVPDVEVIVLLLSVLLEELDMYIPLPPPKLVPVLFTNVLLLDESRKRIPAFATQLVPELDVTLLLDER